VSPRAWAAFAAVSTLWGIPYLFIKLAVDDGVPPAFLAWSRVAVGAAVLLPLAWRKGLLRPLRGHLGAIAAYACCEIVFPFPLIAAGEQHISSSLTAILIASMPLIVALLALRFDASERVGGSRLIGLFIGLAGVVALVGIDVAGNADELLGAGLVLLGTVGYAAAPLIVRARLADTDPRGMIAASLVLSTVLLTPAALIAPPDAVPSATALSSIAVLGLACTALALVLFVALVSEVGAGKAAVITYISPIVAVALGVSVLGERPGVGAVAGLLLILAGSWLATGGGGRPDGASRKPLRSRTARGRSLA
jgi:drug/metabolite transporter (DMT)-like permease